jgi:hypothetical protein
MGGKINQINNIEFSDNIGRVDIILVRYNIELFDIF